jgi:hypothetical protein
MQRDFTSCFNRSTSRARRSASAIAVSIAGIFIVGSTFGLATAAGASTQGSTAASSTSASAVSPCTTRSLSTPFSQWGDEASYFLAPNGGFAEGATGWTLSGGAAATSGGEPWDVSGSGSHSLLIPNGAQAQSTTMCVTRNEDSIRLFVDNRGVQGSILHVEALVENPTTGQTAQTAFDVNGNAAPVGWSPTMVLGIPDLLSGNGTQDLTLIFTTRGTAATWNIDDIFVDPFVSR